MSDVAMQDSAAMIKLKGYASHLMDLDYVELKKRNLEVKRKREAGVRSDDLKEEMLDYLRGESGLKAVMVCFSDLEGRLHSLDYDKDFVADSEDNLTFDGSSIRGFSELGDSDLRLRVDWTSFRWLPADIFGAGKVMVFANVCNADGGHYCSDFRACLLNLCLDLRGKGVVVNVAPEIEGFLMKGGHAEQNFDESKGFELATMSGYFNSLPQDTLRLFIDKFAEAQRALGFENEKDHPEVAPAQFELNFRFTGAIDTADQIQLYKLLARQIAKSMGLTACFLPKPVANLNGSGMHTNISLARDGRNLFYGDGKHGLSETAHKFITGVLYRANDLCLAMNSSVNSYRRLDPNYEAPNEIKTSAKDRSAMVRIPLGNEKSARMEVRTVAPDCNPYLTFFAILKAGLDGANATEEVYDKMSIAVYDREVSKLPGNIYDAMLCFEKSEFMREILGEDNLRKYLELKREVADRSPRLLGSKVKLREIVDHHEVTNQMIAADF